MAVETSHSIMCSVCVVWCWSWAHVHSCFLLIAEEKTRACWYSGCVYNQKSDRSTFVRWDRSSPMKKNAFVRFFTVTRRIMSLYPHSLWLAIWNWLLERLYRMPHGWGLKNLSTKSDFSHMYPSRSRFDYECGAFH